jgi:hypothetical protein
VGHYCQLTTNDFVAAMWSSWAFKSITASHSNIPKKTSSKNPPSTSPYTYASQKQGGTSSYNDYNDEMFQNPIGGEVREEKVQMAVHFLSHPNVRGTPEIHVQFLESKGLNINEIQESLNRIR